MNTLLGIIWVLLNSILLMFILNEIVLVFYSLKNRSKKQSNPTTSAISEHPKVCIQLPIYNEKYVIQRLLDQVLKMDYPNDKLIIQLLDDSTDETCTIIKNYLEDKDLQGKEVQHITRAKREGFKAGALQHGMLQTDAEYFAIFDADFMPDPEFLLRTIPEFQNEQIGVVQSRWTHINENYSLITRAESVMLDAHFGVEQLGRSASSSFINFNGTAGIWRRACIEDAGGWEGDTLTEDLDLSFRAQMKKWRIHYLFDLESPAELPITFSAYRNQQYRWSKGAAECFKKNIKALWKSSVGIGAKIAGTFHLLNSSVYIVMLLLITVAPAIFYINQMDTAWNEKFGWIAYFGIAVNALLLIVLLVGRVLCGKNRPKDFLIFLPSVFGFFSFSIGISVHMTVGVIQGYLGKSTEFVRTPKYGEKHVEKIKAFGYGQKAAFDLRIVEAILMCYGVFWFVVGVMNKDVFTLFYSTTILVGFSMSLFLPNHNLKFSKTNKSESNLSNRSLAARS
jgi:cellulose synthase/poly-beta-1,6-N-acetylglucosamine synthase-like glycosyltransferase